MQFPGLFPKNLVFLITVTRSPEKCASAAADRLGAEPPGTQSHTRPDRAGRLPHCQIPADLVVSHSVLGREADQPPLR